MSMCDVKYKIVKEECLQEGVLHKFYGVVAYQKDTTSKKKKAITSVMNISCDKGNLKKLVKRCNKYKLELVHLNDVIEDFLVEQSC